MKKHLKTLLLSFALVMTAAFSASAQCDITVAIHDDYGDGWTGNEISIYQGAYLVGTLTLDDGYDSTATFMVSNNDSVRIVYTAEGLYSDECSFEVFNADGDTLVNTTYIDDAPLNSILASFLNICSSCPRPAWVSAQYITSSSAEIYWPNDGSSNLHLIEYGVAGFTEGHGTQITTSSYPYLLQGLTQNTEYEVYVSSVCDGSISTSNKVRFRTLHECSQFSSFLATNIRLTSALLRWSIIPGSADYDATTFEITISDGVNLPMTYTVEGDSLIVNGLNPNTQYTAQIVPQCSAYSIEGETITFTTLDLGCLEPDPSILIAANLGSGTEQQDGVPVRSNWGNTISQSVYTAAELSQAGLVAGVLDSIYYTWTNNASYAKHITLLMGHTDRSTASTSEWLALDESVQVYSGAHPTNTSGSTGYKLNRQFAWDGSRNIVITMICSVPSGQSAASAGFYGISSESNRAATSYKGIDGSAISTTTLANNPPQGTKGYLPNIRLVALGCLTPLECAAPAPYVTDIESDYVTIEWVEGYNESEWTAEYRAETDTQWTIASASEGSQSFTFNNLNANTNYRFRIGSVCADTILYSQVAARTKCASISQLPSAENFETYATGAVPNCWSVATEGSNSANPSVVNYSSSKRLQLESHMGKAIASYPDIDETLAINTIQLRFDATKGSSSSSITSDLIVGISEQPCDLNTFVAIDTLTNIPNTATEYIVNFNRYEGEGRYITFVSASLTSATAQNRVLLDNVQLREQPACLAPSRLHLERATTTSLELAWREEGDASQWVIEFADHTFVPGSGLGSTEYASGTSDFTLTGLDSATTYHIYIHADCGSDTSTNIYLAAATLASMPATLPYNCDFEYSGSNGWEFVNGTQTNKWTVGSGNLFVTNSTANTYNNASASVSYATRDIDITDTGMYAYGFEWRCNGESNYDYMRAYLAPATVSLTAGTKYSGISYNGAPQGWTALDGGSQLHNSSWQQRNDSVRINNPGMYKLVFAWINDDSDGSNPPAAIDNIYFMPNRCPAASNLAAATVATGDTIIVSWHESRANSHYQLGYAPAGMDLEQNGTFVNNVTGAQYAFTGLIIGRDYDFYIRTVCGTDTSVWIGPATALYGRSYNMKVTGTDTINACGVTIFDNGGPHGNYAQNCASTLYIMPSASNQTIMISGSAITQGNDDYLTIYDGMGTQGTVLFTTRGTNSNPHIGPIVSETGSMTITFYSNFWDQFEGFRLLASCVRRTNCATPEDVAITRIAYNEAELSWRDSGAYEWIAEYGPAGFVPGTGISQTEFASPMLLTGLTPSTDYDVYLYANCGGDTSFARMVSFRSGCAPITQLPYSYGFEDAVQYGSINECWYKDMTGSSNSNYPEVRTNSANGNRSLLFYANANSNIRSWAAMPLMNDSVANLQVRFQLRRYNTTNGYASFIKVGVMSRPDDPTTFTEIDRFTATSTTEWNEYTSELAEYTGHGRYIAFMADGLDAAMAYNYVYLDNVVVEQAPACGHVRNLSVNVGSLSAMASWTPSRRGTPDLYYVAYREAGDSTWITDSTYTTYYSLTNLNLATTYELRVAASCVFDIATWEATSFTTPNCLGGGDVALGEGQHIVQGIPAATSFGNTISESIYTADELAAAGLTAGRIEAVKLNWASAGTLAKDLSIFIGNTNTTNLSNAADWVPLTQMTQVYNGTHAAGTVGQTTYNFNTSFVWDGTSNIVVALMVNQALNENHTTSSGISLYATNTVPPTTITRYYYRDSIAFDSHSLLSTAASNSSTYRPNITWVAPCDTTATCVSPVAAISSVGANYVDVAWAPGRNESSWNLYQRQVGESAFTLVGSTTQHNYQFAGLEPGHPYQFKIEAVCGTNSAFSVLSATTDCAPISQLPYEERFDLWGTGYNTLPNCWKGTSGYNTSYPYITGATSYTGAGSLFLSADANTYSIAALPEYEGNINQTMLSFEAKAQHDDLLIIGMMNDPNDQSTFVPIASQNISTRWSTYEVPINGYSGNGTYLVVAAGHQNSLSEIYLDNLTLENMPSCLRPDSLTATNATTTSVDIAWRERGSATSWLVEYGPIGFIPGTGTQVSTNTNAMTLTFDNGFEGEYYVRSLCSATDTGFYSRRACPFRTLQQPASIPYSYDFESAAEWAQWQTAASGAAIWKRGNAIAGDGQYSLYLSADDGETFNFVSGTTHSVAYRDIDFGSIDSSYTLTFKAIAIDYTANGEHLMVVVADPVTPVVATHDVSESPWGPVADLMPIAIVEADTIWNTYTASIDHLSGIHRVAFYSYNATHGPIAIDSLSIDYSECPRPTNVVVTINDTDAESVSVSWDGPSAASYQVTYTIAGTNTNLSVRTSTNHVVLVGLQPATHYQLSVRKLCGSSNSMQSETVDFTTLCAPMPLPYCENFEGVFGTRYNYEGSLPSCWETAINAVMPVYTPHVIGGGPYTYVNSGLQSLIMTSGINNYGPTKIVKLPMMDAPLNALAINFWMATESHLTGELAIGYIPADATDLEAAFVPVRIIPASESTTASSGGRFDSVAFDSVPQIAANIAFRWTCGGSQYSQFYSVCIDDIMVTAPGLECHVPVLANPIVDFESATISWSGSASGYEVSLTSADALIWSSEVLVNTNSYTFSGLTDNTLYYYRVRSACDSGEVSAWATGSFTTDELPCYEVTNIRAIATSIDRVTLAWDVNSESPATSWIIRIYNSSEEIIDTVSTNPATISGLYDNTEYHVSIQSRCAALVFSDWSEPITIRTATCYPVSNVEATGITGVAATISWTAGGNEQAWVINYGEEGFPQGHGVSDTVSATTYWMHGLENYTSYDVYVKALCADNIFSTWSTRLTFSTTQGGEGVDAGERNYILNIYPNPAHNQATLSMSGIDGMAEITITDINGRQIRSMHISNEGNSTFNLDIKGLSQGTYFVRVLADGVNAVRKLIIR